MAFHASPATLQNIVSTTSELWPSVSSALTAPWRQLRTPVPRAVEQRPGQTKEVQSRTIHTEAPRITISEPLNNISVSALRFQPSQEVFQAQYGSKGLYASLPKQSLSSCNPLVRRLFSPVSRQYSTSTRFGPFNLRPIRSPITLGLSQQRTLFNGNTSQNLLAHLEATANNNPGSATAQNAFYSALLRANLPQIVIERYQTGRYASNAACEQMYVRALEKIGAAERPGSLATAGQAGNMGGLYSGAQNNAMSQQQLQAVGQAVAARALHDGGATASVRGGSGAKEAPLHVVVEESRGSAVFKWVKFLLFFGLITYFFIVVVTLIVDTTGMIKKVSGAKTSEAKPELQKTRFSDVQGCEEAKEELQELVEFLKAPDKFSALGGKMPKGILLVGPPGTGKTLLARAVAGEAGVPFFYMSGSEFDEVYVGVGAKRVRELFEAARQKAPAIVFIDELDAIGGKRNERDAAYVKQTLNQLLTELDGFDQSSGVIFLAATNFPQLLDKALTRPGRFDRNVVVPLPDVRGRAAILKHHMRNIKMDVDVDPAVIARGTPGFSGAELENVVNQAAVHASKNKQKKVKMSDLEWAKDKIMMGAERRSAVIRQEDKIATAYHEGGHALVAMFTPSADPLYKATIMPRGHALGITFQLPEIDKVSMSKKEYLAKIDVCMGGKVAEELVYGPDEVSGGAASDIQQATSIAYAMVTQMGMSPILGNVDLHNNYAKLSTETKQLIESEVRRIIDEGRQRATNLLTEKRQELDRLANALVEYEDLNKEEMERVVRGEKLPEKLKASSSTPIKVPDFVLPPGFGGAGGPGSAGPGIDSPGAGAGAGTDPPKPYPAGSPQEESR